MRIEWCSPWVPCFRFLVKRGMPGNDAATAIFTVFTGKNRGGDLAIPGKGD